MQSTSELLLDNMLKMGAVCREGEIVAPCPVCQEMETNEAKFKLAINCGDKYLAVCFCRHCCHQSYSGNRKEWWFKVCDFYGFDGNVFLTPYGEDSRRVWASLDLNRKSTKRKVPPAPIDVRHRVYSDLLHYLTLTTEHQDWLSKRGIDRNWAVTAGYRSTVEGVSKGSFQYCLLEDQFSELLSKHKKDLHGCPGFFDIDDKPKVGLRYPAVLIPCRDRYGRIQAIKQRLLDGKGPRMRWLASSGKVVPAVVNKPHYPKGVGFPNSWNTLWVTEGERKADCNWINGNPTIGVTGTGCWLSAIEAVATSITPNATIVLAFDKDTAGIVTTAKLVEEFKVRKLNIKEVQVADWSSEKGIDDAISKGLTITIRTVLTKEGMEAKEKQAPPHKQQPHKLQDEESVIDWLLTAGPTDRNKIPTTLSIMSKLLNTKKVRFCYKEGSQVIFV